ncbi:MAG: alpha/beta hydrolase [Planctomycetes bacterium]|nr:alpha/beta hydrolase [Planctomycetota bacterium]
MHRASLSTSGTPRPSATSIALKYAWRWTRLFLIAYLVILLGMLWLENALLYFPRPYDGGTRWQVVEPNVEDAQFQAADGTRLHGWYFHHPNPKAVVLFAHGNAGNVAYWSEVGLQWRRDLDVSILVFDYRGYGKSEGSPGEAGLLADGRAARAWLAKRAGVAEDQIVLFGRSIGGGVMVDLATDGARGLILERTFTSIPDAAACHYPWLPVRWLMRNRFDSLAKIKNYQGPLLMSHGDADTIVPIELGRQLFDAANDPKEWISVAGGEHNDEQPRSYYAAVQRFLAGLPKAPAP